jgi:hypothetical protein
MSQDGQRRLSEGLAAKKAGGQSNPAALDEAISVEQHIESQEEAQLVALQQQVQAFDDQLGASQQLLLEGGPLDETAAAAAAQKEERRRARRERRQAKAESDAKTPADQGTSSKPIKKKRGFFKSLFSLGKSTDEVEDGQRGQKEISPEKSAAADEQEPSPPVPPWPQGRAEGPAEFYKSGPVTVGLALLDDAVYSVGDAVEVYSKSLGGWQRGAVLQSEDDKLIIQYGDRQRVVDLADPKLETFFRTATGFEEGDFVEYYSETLGGWQRGYVKEADMTQGKLAVQYGERQRVIDMSDPKLDTFFRAAKLFVVGDSVEIFSSSLGDWQPGTVVEADMHVGKISVQYGERMRVVDLTDSKLDVFFRAKEGNPTDSGDRLPDPSSIRDVDSAPTPAPAPAPVRYAETGNSLLDSLRVAQQKLQKQKHDVETLSLGGFKGVVAKAAEAAAAEQQKVASGFWFDKKSAVPDAPEETLRLADVSGRADSRTSEPQQRSTMPPTPPAIADLTADEPDSVTSDPLLSKANHLLAQVAGLDAMQETLKERLPPPSLDSTFAEDMRQIASPAATHGSAHSHESSSKALVVPDAAVQEAQAAMEAQRSEILALLATFEAKAAADQQQVCEGCATVIQMAFRRHMVRRRCAARVRAQARLEREAVRTIWRGWRARKRRQEARLWRASLWQVRRAELKRSVIQQKVRHLAARKIQATWRGYVCREELVREKAAVIFQKHIRRILLRRRCATQLQALARGYLCRHAVGPAMHQLTQTRAQAALMIQKIVRGRNYRRYSRRRFWAILTLQSRMRGAFRAREVGAGKLQRAYRARDERRRASAYFVLRRLLYAHVYRSAYQQALLQQQDQACTAVQRMMRGKSAKRDYLIKRAAVCRMQRVWRGRQGRLYATEKDQERVVAQGQVFLWAVERLQARFRGRRTRAHMSAYFLQVAATVRVQRHWRGHAARQRIAHSVDRWCAACEIQHHTRIFLLRRRCAASVVQRQFVKYRSIHEAAAENRRMITCIQSVWRGKMGRREAASKWRELDEQFAECYRINRAIVCIQRAWRLHDAARRAYKFAAQIAACTIIQRCWRRWKHDLRRSTEWAQRYHPMRDRIGQPAGLRPSSRARSLGGMSGASAATRTTASAIDTELELDALERVSEPVREARMAARMEQSVWVRDTLGVMAIWMKDEAAIATRRDSDQNMAHFFFKRGKPLAAVRCLEQALRQQPAEASVAQRCTININIATVLSELNEFAKAAEVLESSIGLLVADVKAQEKAAAAVIAKMGGSDTINGGKSREGKIPRNSERSFALTGLAVCYHNLAVQKLFLDSPGAAAACAAAAVRLATDTGCLPVRHAWLQRMERTADSARRYQEEGGGNHSGHGGRGSQPAWWEADEKTKRRATKKVVPADYDPLDMANIEAERKKARERKKRGKGKGKGSKQRRSRADHMRKSIEATKSMRRNAPRGSKLKSTRDRVERLPVMRPGSGMSAQGAYAELEEAELDGPLPLHKRKVAGVAQQVASDKWSYVSESSEFAGAQWARKRATTPPHGSRTGSAGSRSAREGSQQLPEMDHRGRFMSR